MDELTYRKGLLDHLAGSWNDTPAADGEPVARCRWIDDRVPFCNVCPVCGAVVDRQSVRRKGKLNFCPNCGRDMREASDG